MTALRTLAAGALAALLLAAPLANADTLPGSTYTAAITPTATKPGEPAVHYTMTLTTGDASTQQSASRVNIEIPAGFTVAAGTPAAEVGGSCAGKWLPTVSTDGTEMTLVPDDLVAPFCPGATMTIEFDASTAADIADGPYPWISHLRKGKDEFTLSGSVPSVTVATPSDPPPPPPPPPSDPPPPPLPPPPAPPPPPPTPAVPDTTPPALVGNLRATVGYGFVRLSWALPSDLDFDHVSVLASSDRRAPLGASVYTGRATSYAKRPFQNGSYYRFQVVSYDHTGNASRPAAVAIAPSALLRSPRDGSAVRRPPLLSWLAAPKASFYNVQLYRAGRKVLSTWPTRARFQLRGSWTFGSPQQLARGAYRWYVWPAFGRRAKARYGQLLGQGGFTVR